MAPNAVRDIYQFAQECRDSGAEPQLLGEVSGGEAKGQWASLYQRRE
jgi:hypothetical protein